LARNRFAAPDKNLPTVAHTRVGVRLNIGAI